MALIRKIRSYTEAHKSQDSDTRQTGQELEVMKSVTADQQLTLTCSCWAGRGTAEALG